jgi:cyclopropane fatty-acyl-phospholipid synthase-like methyltransferase
VFAANGFDTGGARLDQEDYQELIAGVRGTLGITSSSRVLDVGCGCGTVLRDIGAGSALGVDYSSSQVRLAQKLFPQAEFQHSEANAFEVAEGEFDAVLSFGVMQYLPDRAYVREMLARMTRSLRGGGCGLLLDIPDAATREACEAYRAETIPDYREKYAATQHTYFDRDELIGDLRTLGCRAWVIEHFMRHYGYRPFRFNLQFEKPV